jgi:hypothetical protein
MFPLFATNFVHTAMRIRGFINDLGGKFATGINNTGGGEFATGGNDTSGIFYQLSKKF